MAKRDILSQLNNPNNVFYKDDLDLIINELELGEYDEGYIFECKEIIKSLRSKGEEAELHIPDNIVANPGDILPLKDRASSNDRSINDQILYEIYHLREFEDYPKRFIDYINSTPELDEKFLEYNIQKFDKNELNDILNHKLFTEPFLDKYFDALPVSGICKKQEFSEEFYMKHYEKLNFKDIMKNTKIKWKNKANRSDKLETFLRLKGIA